MTRRLVIVFYKNPVAGKVKTRLAKSVGEQAALAIYKELVDRTRQAVNHVQADVAVYYADHVVACDLWDAYDKKSQSGTDLGKRMFHAIRDGLSQGYNSVCLIGTDIYELTASIVNEAFDKLDRHDLVLGPAKDGGYYLIGMKEPDADVFDLTSWSTPKVLDETLEIARKKGKSYDLLPVLNDIDIEEDLVNTDLIVPLPKP